MVYFLCFWFLKEDLALYLIAIISNFLVHYFWGKESRSFERKKLLTAWLSPLTHLLHPDFIAKLTNNFTGLFKDLISLAILALLITIEVFLFFTDIIFPISHILQFITHWFDFYLWYLYEFFIHVQVLFVASQFFSIILVFILYIPALQFDFFNS